MGIFEKKTPQDPEPAPSVSLDFSIVKKGYDPGEVAQYVQHLLSQHESDLGMVQSRIVESQQQAKQQIESSQEQVAKLQEELVEAKQNLEAARSFGGVDPEREAELLEAKGRIRELEIELSGVREELQGAEESDSIKVRAVEIKLEEAQKRLQSMESTDNEAVREAAEHAEQSKQQAEEHARRLAEARTRIAELESQIGGEEDLVASRKALESDLAEALADLASQKALNETLKIELSSGMDSPKLTEDLERLQTDNGRLQKKVAELEAQGDAHEELERLRGETENQKARIQELENAPSSINDAELQLELKHTRLDLEKSEKEVERIRTELNRVREKSDSSLREAAQAAARVELLEKELAEAREHKDELGTEARRMVEALQASREQQERDLEREMQLAMEEAEAVRRRARQDAETIRLEAMEAVSLAESHRQTLSDETRARARKVTDELHTQITALMKAADERTAQARSSEEQLRMAVRQAAEVEMWQKTQERDMLREEIEKLVGERNNLIEELSAYRKEFSHLLRTAHSIENGDPVPPAPESPSVVDLPAQAEQQPPAAPLAASAPVEYFAASQEIPTEPGIADFTSPPAPLQDQAPMPPAAPPAAPAESRPPMPQTGGLEPTQPEQQYPIAEPDMSGMPSVPQPGFSQIAQTEVHERSRGDETWFEQGGRTRQEAAPPVPPEPAAPAAPPAAADVQPMQIPPDPLDGDIQPPPSQPSAGGPQILDEDD